MVAEIVAHRVCSTLIAGSISAHFDRRLVLALTHIDDMPEQAVRCPFGVTNLYDHLGGHPMNPAEHER